MTNTTYRVLFKGGIKAGENAAVVKQRLADRLKLSSSRIETLFSGKTTIIKKGVSLAVCEKIQKIFAASGAVCRIEPDTDTVEGRKMRPAANRAVGPPPLPPVAPPPSGGPPNAAASPGTVDTFCTACGTPIKLNDLACPGCGKKVKKKDGLPGCAIAAIVVGIFFVAMAVIGILAAIAIPNFIAYRNKAVDAEIRIELKNVAMAQQAYYSEHGVYTLDLEALGYQQSDNAIAIAVVSADKNCFTAVGSSPRLHRDISIDCHGTLKEIDKTD